MQYRQCENDEDFAKIGLFILKRKYDLHPSYSTLDMVALLYSYVTEGHLYQVSDEDGRIVSVAAYYHGTREREFADKDVLFIDLVIVDRKYRGSRAFLNGFRNLLEHLAEAHPEAEEMRFAAISDNEYVTGLYSKFASSSYTREGTIGQETVYCERISQIKGRLSRYNPL